MGEEPEKTLPETFLAELSRLGASDLSLLQDELMTRFGSEYMRRSLALLHHAHGAELGRLTLDSIYKLIRYAIKNYIGRRLYFLSDCLDQAISGVPQLDTNSIQDIQSEFARCNIVKIESMDAIKESRDALLLLACNSDQQMLKALKQARERQIAFLLPRLTHPAARYFERNDLARQILAVEARLPLKKFDLADFENIIQALEITRNVRGSYVEIGVYQGRSARIALRYMQLSGLIRPSFFLDTFSGFDYEEARTSLEPYWSGRLADASMEAVADLLRDFDSCRLIRSNILMDELPSEAMPIALANVDVDSMNATQAALEKLSKRMQIGGVIIVEDQGHTPLLGGAYLATQDFLDAHPEYYGIHLQSGQMYLLKMASGDPAK